MTIYRSAIRLAFLILAVSPCAPTGAQEFLPSWQTSSPLPRIRRNTPRLPAYPMQYAPLTSEYPPQYAPLTAYPRTLRPPQHTPARSGVSATLLRVRAGVSHALRPAPPGVSAALRRAGPGISAAVRRARSGGRLREADVRLVLLRLSQGLRVRGIPVSPTQQLQFEPAPHRIARRDRSGNVLFDFGSGFRLRAGGAGHGGIPTARWLGARGLVPRAVRRQFAGRSSCRRTAIRF
jgi:hypothetical protein